MTAEDRGDSDVEVLWKTYKEVLDATKHQDDKIGRLLTGIAFLTAAALALAGLDGEANILQRWHFAPYDVEYTLIMFALFIICVLVSVSLLLESLTTPLRLPGQWSRPGDDALKSIPASHLYFIEIAHLTLDEWKRQWSDPEYRGGLQATRKRDLVRETHNLAERTATKYDRTTEAVAFFSLGLVFLAVALVLAAFTASYAQGHGPQLSSAHSANLQLRLCLAATLGTFYLTFAVGQARRSNRRDHGAPDVETDATSSTQSNKKLKDRILEWIRSHSFDAELISAASIAALVACTVAVFPRGCVAVVIDIIFICALISVHLFVRWTRTKLQLESLEKRSTDSAEYFPNGFLSEAAALRYRLNDIRELKEDAEAARGWYVFGAVIVTVAIICVSAFGWYVWQLNIALAVTASLPAATLLQSRFRARRRTIRARLRHNAAREAVNPLATGPGHP